MNSEQGGSSCDVRVEALSKLSAGDKLGPDEALDASTHAHQLQTMTSTMGKYCDYSTKHHP